MIYSTLKWYALVRGATRGLRKPKHPFLKALEKEAQETYEQMKRDINRQVYGETSVHPH